MEENRAGQKINELPCAARLFLQAVSAGIHGGSLPEQGEKIDEQTLDSVMSLVNMHHLPLAAEQILRANRSDPRFAAVRRELMHGVVYQARAQGELLALLKALHEAGIPVLVVKGALCRQLYPKPELRPSSDEDIFVSPDHCPQAEAVFQSLGFTRDAADQEDDPVHNWTRGALRVELHTRLLETDCLPPESFRDILSDPFEDAVTLDIQGYPVPTLSHHRHFLYLLLHYYKHFLAGGVGIRQICDICLYAGHYEGDIDWPLLWEQVHSMGLELLLWNLRDIGLKYLGFSQPLMPCHISMPEADSFDLLVDTLGAGVFGSSSVERKHSATMTIRAAREGKHRGGVKAAMFPGAKELEGRYPYLKKHPWLLPVAWMARAWGYVREGRGLSKRASQAVQIGQQRLELLEKYCIIRRS